MIKRLHSVCENMGWEERHLTLSLGVWFLGTQSLHVLVRFVCVASSCLLIPVTLGVISAPTPALT